MMVDKVGDKSVGNLRIPVGKTTAKIGGISLDVISVDIEPDLSGIDVDGYPASISRFSPLSPDFPSLLLLLYFKGTSL